MEESPVWSGRPVAPSAFLKRRPLYGAILEYLWRVYLGKSDRRPCLRWSTGRRRDSTWRKKKKKAGAIRECGPFPHLFHSPLTSVAGAPKFIQKGSGATHSHLSQQKRSKAPPRRNDIVELGRRSADRRRDDEQWIHRRLRVKARSCYPRPVPSDLPTINQWKEATVTPEVVDLVNPSHCMVMPSKKPLKIHYYSLKNPGNPPERSYRSVGYRLQLLKLK